MSTNAYTNPCSSSYPGAQAFEAVETKAIADYLATTKDQVRAFVDVHSYGQLCESSVIL
jgi:extracellular matrix protein 14